MHFSHRLPGYNCGYPVYSHPVRPLATTAPLGAGAERGAAGEGEGDEQQQLRRRRRRRWQDALFPYLSVLLYVDAGAAIDVLSVAMDSPEAIFRRETTPTTTGPPGDMNNGLASPTTTGTASPAFLRESSSSSSLASSEAAGGARKGSARNGEALGGGVWGRRLGRRGRTARAIGWSSAAATASSQGDTGAGEGGRWRRVGMGAVAAAAENSCPSRRSIVEAVTAVLAPHLSARAEQLEEAASAAAAAAAAAAAGDDGSAEDAGGGGGLSASAFVHGSQPAAAAAAATMGTEEPNGDDKPTTTATATATATAAAAAAAAAAAESPSSLLRDRDGQEWWAAARPHLFGFVAKYLELSLVSVGPRLTNAVLVNAATGASNGTGGDGGDGGLEAPADPQARWGSCGGRGVLAVCGLRRLVCSPEWYCRKGAAGRTSTVRVCVDGWQDALRNVLYIVKLFFRLAIAFFFVAGC